MRKWVHLETQRSGVAWAREALKGAYRIFWELGMACRVRSLKCCLRGHIKYREVWNGKSQSGEMGGGQYYTDVEESAVKDGGVSREGVRRRSPGDH